ncbi:replicative DNA helicase [Andreesenia angusta]|uniref:Replicative DNA helicase n=1 Tax=Andreesenia angusta TaxID=39480 RepID=A0A1S1V691_9FIRM|nr:replicative DNA helicase [Andreesenia angusta]OHW61627.1 replicative DNA helicase [Andreesenia angusta]
METNEIGAGTVGRVPPHSLEAERSVLGAMLLDREAIVAGVEMIRSEDFYHEAHRQIYESIISVFTRDEPVDLITLSEELKKRDILEAIGGTVYLAELSNEVSTTANIRYYCGIVEEKSILRKLIRASSDIIAKSYEDNEEIGSIVEQAEKKIFDITQKRNQEGPEDIKTVLIESLSKIEKMAESQGSLTGVTTGFIDLDNKTSGLQKSDLVLIAARPAMGKTAFTLNVAINAALKGGASVGIFSLEMSKDQLVQRMLSAEAHIELQKIIHGNIGEDDWPKLISAMGPLSKANIFIDDTPGITLTELKAKCRKLKIEKGLDLVMIDYLQLMSGEGRTESRQQEISSISRGLKGLAKELDCPVVALSQLSRAPELRSDHRPILSDLRESGAIEQDADIVMFLYRDEYYDPDSEKKNIGEVIIAKHRNGPIGNIELVFVGEYTKFLNLEKNRVEP